MSNEQQQTALRMRLPADLDEQTMRSSIDRALQIIAADLTSVCGPVLAKKYGKGWDLNSFEGKHPLRVADPAYWAAEFKIVDSPAFKVFAESSHKIRKGMNELRALRNDLYHFRATLTPQDTVDLLHGLSLLSKRMHLPCFHDIETVRLHFVKMHRGELPPSLTVDQALLLLSKVDELEEELKQEQLAKEQTENALEAAAESLQAAKAAAAANQTAGTESKQAVLDLESEVARLKNLAAQQADQVAELESAATDASQAPLPKLPPASTQAVTEFLTLAQHAGQIFRVVAADVAQGEVDNALDRLEKARERVVTLANDVPAAETSALGTDDPQGMLEDGLESVAQAVVSGRAWIVEASTSELDAAKQASLVLNLVEHGAKAVRDVVDLMDVAQWSTTTQEPAPVERPDDTKAADRGAEWSWPPGEDVWVLSLRSGRLRRPRTSEVGEFTALYGDDLESQLVTDWIALSPQGGRVHIDEDGDACVLGSAGHYIYLGRVSST